MKFSAWSLLVISGCSLVFASSASAHVSVSPTKVEQGAAVDLSFATPNEDDPAGITQVTVTPPAGFQVDDGAEQPGWTQSRAGRSIVWAGGNIPNGEFETFVLRGTAPKRTGQIVFHVRVAGRSGRGVTYPVVLDVVGSKTDWGKPALIVAIGGALLALGAFFVALYVWLRPPR